MNYAKPVFVILLIINTLFMAACAAATEAAVAPQNTEPALTALPSSSTPMPSPTAVPSASTPSPSPTKIPATPTSSPKPEIEIDLAMEIAEGDPGLGLNRALSNGCSHCHVPINEAHEDRAPQFAASDNLPRIFERGELRMADPAYKGRATTNMEYIIESIFLPEVYFVSGDWEETMPTFFHVRISDEDLANIIAWMRTIE